MFENTVDRTNVHMGFGGYLCCEVASLQYFQEVCEDHFKGAVNQFQTWQHVKMVTALMYNIWENIEVWRGTMMK